MQAHGSYFPHQGLNLHPLHWQHKVLATGPPGKSPNQFFGDPFLNISCLTKAYQTLRKDMKDRDQNKQTIRGLTRIQNLQIHNYWRQKYKQGGS